MSSWLYFDIYIVADMYCSRIGMKENIDLEDISLPQPVELPSDSNSYVLFDLETTGLDL